MIYHDILVELLRRYSNQGDLLDDLNRTLLRLHSAGKVVADEELPDNLASTCQHSPRERLLSERLTPDDIVEMIERHRAGATIQKVATEFKVGKTSLKWLFRTYGGRQKDWRFSPERVDTIVQRYRDGGTIPEVAAAFDIGTTKLKRLIREHQAKRRR